MPTPRYALAILSTIAALSVAPATATAQSQPQAIGYHVSAVTPLAGKLPRWDHLSVDPANRHLFIGNRASGLTVVDIDTGIVATVAETSGSAGAAIASDLGLGFSDRGDAQDVTIFDLKTLAVTGHIAMATHLDGVFYDPATHMGYTNNAEAGSVTFFDPVTRTLGATVALGSKKPEFSDVDGLGRAFIALQDKNAVGVIDTRTQKLEATWPVDCEAPTALVHEPQSRRLFIACRGIKPVMVVLDDQTGLPIASLPIGYGCDAVTFNPSEKLVLVSNGASATIQVFKQDSADAYHLAETAVTRQGARTMALDPKTGRAFAAFAEMTILAITDPDAAPRSGNRPSGPLQLITLEFGPIE